MLSRKVPMHSVQPAHARPLRLDSPIRFTIDTALEESFNKYHMQSQHSSDEETLDDSDSPDVSQSSPKHLNKLALPKATNMQK